MSETKTYKQGPLTGGREFPEVVNGWTRSETWLSDAPSVAGELAVGLCTEVLYRKVLPDGRVLGVETLVYFEVSPQAYFEDEDLTNAQIVMSERDFFHSAPNQEAFDASEYDVEDYEYVEAGVFFRNLEGGEVTDRDMAWLVEDWGDVDARDFLLWDGEPIR